MEDPEKQGRHEITPANDDHRTAYGNDEEAVFAPSARADHAVLTLARLIGRRIAREQFMAVRAANDNARLPEEAEGRKKDTKLEKD